MVSRFESTFRDRVIPAAERAFGVTVYFIFEDGSEFQFTGLVDLNGVSGGDEVFTRVDGTLTIKTSALVAKVEDTDVLTSVRIREEVFHVFAKSPSICGFTVFNIRRKASEQDHTNMYDMNDQQAVWHDP